MPITASGDQFRAQYARNAASMQKDADKARATGKKVRGGTAEYWQEAADRFVRYSTMTDDEMRAHFAGIAARARAEVAQREAR